MKKILFLSAMEVEADVIRRGIEEHIFDTICEAEVIETKIGMINAILPLYEKLDKYDEIVNFGTCGASNRYIQGDIVVIDEFYNASFSEDVSTSSKYNPANIKYNTLNDSNANALFSGDIFTTSINKDFYKFINRDFYLFDMEAYGQKAICDKYKIKYKSIKIVSDNLSSSSYKDFDSFLIDMTNDSINICKKIAKLI